MSDMKKLMALFESTDSGSVMVMVSGEGGSQIYQISQDDLNRIRELFAEAEETEEYPEEVNYILDQYQEVQVAATISTHGDGWGFHEGGE